MINYWFICAASLQKGSAGLGAAGRAAARSLSHPVPFGLGQLEGGNAKTRGMSQRVRRVRESAELVPGRPGPVGMLQHPRAARHQVLPIRREAFLVARVRTGGCSRRQRPPRRLLEAEFCGSRSLAVVLFASARTAGFTPGRWVPRVRSGSLSSPGDAALCSSVLCCVLRGSSSLLKVCFRRVPRSRHVGASCAVNQGVA